MKKLLLILSIIFTFAAVAQDPLTYGEVVEVEGVSADELYVRAKSWFAKTYNDANSVIKMDDKEAGQIIGKGNFSYTSNVFYGSNGTKGYVNYTISVFVKEGRYKYEITQFFHEGNPLNEGGKLSFNLITTASEYTKKNPAGGKKWKTKVWLDIKESIDKDVKFVIKSLKKGMAIQSTGSSNDDW